jgi:hypothetical protein
MIRNNDIKTVRRRPFKRLETPYPAVNTDNKRVPICLGFKSREY